MRRDFDYVAMSDYEADTKEITETAANAVNALRRKLRDQERLFVAAILAVGGKLAIGSHHLIRADKITTTRSYRPETDETIYSVEPEQRG